MEQVGRQFGTTHRLGQPLNPRYSWLALCDTLIYFSACYLATWLYFLSQPAPPGGFLQYLHYKAFLFASLTTLAMYSMGLYYRRLREPFAGIVVRMVGAFALGTLAITILMVFFPFLHLPGGVLLYGVALAFTASLITRLVFSRTAELEAMNRRVLVLGAGRRAAHIAARMRRKSDCLGFRVVGYVRFPGEEVAVKGEVVNLDQPLSRYVQDLGIHQLVVALDKPGDTMPREELLRCRLQGIPVLGILDFFEQEADKVLVEEASPEWFIFAGGFQRRFLGRAAKRLLDLIAGIALFLILWPVMLITAIAIKLEDGFGAPVLFCQDRVGLNGKVFRVMKFRSMRTDAEADGRPRWASADDQRITGVGRVIRKLRIDELPQIFNVLGGDMSLVGPRPERPEFVCELAKGIPFFDERHSVKPGITGWAQLNYPYGASPTDAMRKLEFDLYYIKNQSLFLDFMVLLQTVEVVLFRKGAQ